MSQRRFLGAVAVLAVLATTACVEDPIQPDLLIPLSEAEAELLGLQVFRQALSVGLEASRGADSSAVAAPMLAVERAFVEDSVTVACDLGGTLKNKIELSVEVDQEAGVGSLTLTLTQSHTGCLTKENDVEFRMDGAPAVVLSMKLDFDSSGTMRGSGTVTGGVTASVDYRSSTCVTDLAFTTLDQADGTSTSTVSGTMCGQAVSGTLDDLS